MCLASFRKNFIKGKKHNKYSIYVSVTKIKQVTYFKLDDGGRKMGLGVNAQKEKSFL